MRWRSGLNDLSCTGNKGDAIAEQSEEKPQLESRADQKREDVEAGAVVGATGLGCLGFVTLPWSIIIVAVFIIFVIVWCIHRFALR